MAKKHKIDVDMIDKLKAGTQVRLRYRVWGIGEHEDTEYVYYPSECPIYPRGLYLTRWTLTKVDYYVIA